MLRKTKIAHTILCALAFAGIVAAATPSFAGKTVGGTYSGTPGDTGHCTAGNPCN
jgi:hypothetical protein